MRHAIVTLRLEIQDVIDIEDLGNALAFAAEKTEGVREVINMTATISDL